MSSPQHDRRGCGSADSGSSVLDGVKQSKETRDKGSIMKPVMMLSTQLPLIIYKLQHSSNKASFQGALITSVLQVVPF